MSDAQTSPGGQSINTLPNPDAFSAPPGYKKKEKKKRKIDEPGGLTINSLMDIMTIILVFLIKSFSSNPVQLKQAHDLKPPFSKSMQAPTASTAITLTLNNILVDDQPTLKIEKGVVAEVDRSSGGFLVEPLFQRLQEAVDHQKKVAKFNSAAKFEGIVTIIADRNVPFTLLSQAMYTAGQAQYSKFKFMVIQGG